jgi:hypothetical protein
MWTTYERPLGSTESWAPGQQRTDDVDTVLHEGPPRRRRTTLVTGLAVAAVVVAAVAGVGAYEVFGGHGSASASEAISTAAAQSLNQKTVTMSMQMDITAAGMHEHVTGNGAFDFDAQQGTMTLSIPLGGQATIEQLILDGQTAYVSLPPGLQPAGKHWVSMDTSEVGSSTNALGSGFSQFDDPGALLQRLQSQGGTITPLGPTTHDGTSVTAYSVSLPSSQLEKGLAQAGLPAALKQFASGLSLPDITMKVYVAPDGLLRGIDIPITFGILGQSLSEDFQMNFSDYGAPVTVTPPPSNEVVPFSQLMGGLGGLGGLGSTGNTGTL